MNAGADGEHAVDGSAGVEEIEGGGHVGGCCEGTDEGGEERERDDERTAEDHVGSGRGKEIGEVDWTDSGRSWIDFREAEKRFTLDGKEVGIGVLQGDCSGYSRNVVALCWDDVEAEYSTGSKLAGSCQKMQH